MNLNDIDDFVQKSTVLHQTIRGIADGTIDDKTIDLSEYGILTQDQQKEEEERKIRAKQQLEREREEQVKKEREREKAQWWKGAVCIYGPREDEREVVASGNDIDTIDNNKQRCIERCSEESIRKRYSSDYSRWSDDAYTPDDEATNEEEEYQKKLMEKIQNDEFEKVNKEWCEQIKGDIKKRDNESERKEQRAASLRKDGNKYFQKKKYADALAKYSTALQITPYAVNILTNMALVHEKLNCWEEAVEYCSRAIHIDKACTKALFLRHKAFIELNNDGRALDDLNRCQSINPDNILFHESQLKLSLKLKNDSIESEVDRIIFNSHKPEIESSVVDQSMSVETFRGLTLENIFFIVSAEGGDPNRSSMIKKQCQFVDAIMNVITKCGVTFKACDAFQIFANKPHLTLWNVFVYHKLLKCSIASAYMRKSGHLKELICKVQSFCESYDTMMSDEKIAAMEILEMTSELSKSDTATRIFVVDCLKIEELFQLFTVKVQNSRDVDLISSLGGFLLACTNYKCESFNTVSLLIAKCEDFWQHLCNRMNWCSNQQFPKESHVYVCDVVSSCANLIAIVLTCPKLKRIVLRKKGQSGTTDNPVKSLLSNVRLSLEISKKDAAKPKEMRESITKALLVLSTCSETRDNFSHKDYDDQFTSHLVRVLLALSNSPKSELEQTREMTLMTLTNLLTTIDSNDKGNCLSIGRDVVSYSGIEILLSLCIGKISSPIIKHRSSGLLSRLVSSLSIRLDDGTTNIIWKEFLDLTSNESKWATASPDLIVSQSMAMTASNLLKILNLSANNIQWCGMSDAHAILNLLPRPKTNSKGKVDEHSVCQPPERPQQNSALSYVSSTPVFHANVLKLLIKFLDSTPAHHIHVIEAQGIDHLVCLIANFSAQNGTIAKNAASALARLVKGGDTRIKERCRELRGMEMLIELGNAGRI